MLGPALGGRGAPGGQLQRGFQFLGVMPGRVLRSALTGGDQVTRFVAFEQVDSASSPTVTTSAVQPTWDAEEIVVEFFKQLVEDNLLGADLRHRHPAAVKPLAKPHRSKPGLVEAWDLIMGGVGLAPAYSSMTRSSSGGGWSNSRSRRPAATQGDATGRGLPRAMEFGMPPQGGMGLGIDRLMRLSPACRRCAVNAGRQIMQGLINGIRSMISNLSNVLGGITNMIPDLKGPPTRDRSLLYDAGRLVMDGFIRGLESRYSAVRRTLRGLTEDVSRTQFASPGLMVGGGAMTARLAGAINGSLSAEPAMQKTFNYYAAPGSSLGSQEDLFAAAGRARMVGW